MGALANIERTFRVIQHLQLDVATIVVAVRAQLTFTRCFRNFAAKKLLRALISERNAANTASMEGVAEEP